MSSLNEVNSVKRSLDQNMDDDMSLSFSSLLQDTENTSIKGRQGMSLERSHQEQRFVSVNSCAKII